MLINRLAHSFALCEAKRRQTKGDPPTISNRFRSRSLCISHELIKGALQVRQVPPFWVLEVLQEHERTAARLFCSICSFAL